MARRQAAHLLVSLRQKILAIPQTYSRRLLNISDFEKMSAKLKEIAHSILSEIKDLPHCAEPGWREKIEEEQTSRPKKK
jgi:hypothetical protein